jgi:hypothetical protein
VHESVTQAPLIIEYVQNAALIVTSEKTAMLVAASGPEGRKGEQGQPGSGILVISWVGEMVLVEYEGDATPSGRRVAIWTALIFDSVSC